MLEAAAPSIRAWLALSLFTGIREAEMRRLDWRDVDFEGGIVVVGTGISKLSQRRTIPIQPNLRVRLKPVRQTIGKILPGKREPRKLIDAAKRADPEMSPRARKTYHFDFGQTTRCVILTPITDSPSGLTPQPSLLKWATPPASSYGTTGVSPAARALPPKIQWERALRCQAGLRPFTMAGFSRVHVTAAAL
jgi:hypothetical protein